MIYEKFIIESNSKENTIEVLQALSLNTLTHYTEIITSKLVFVDGVYDTEELNTLLNIDLELEVSIVELDEGYYINQFKDYSETVTDMIGKFIKESNISDDINYFLELITEKGGHSNLSYKEIQRLDELNMSQKKNTTK